MKVIPNFSKSMNVIILNANDCAFENENRIVEHIKTSLSVCDIKHA